MHATPKWAGLLVVALLSGCSSSQNSAPVESVGGDATNAYSLNDRGDITGDSYTVQRGDTLFSIAWRASTTVRDLVRLNNIESPDLIFAGQTLQLRDGTSETSNAVIIEPAATVSAEASVPEAAIVETPIPEAIPEAAPVEPPSTPTSYSTSTDSGAPSATSSNSGIVWSWPANGKIVATFSTAETGNKGIDIAGSKGQPVYAASSGTVAYAGNALRGYGNLIILKHNEDYLSAYAHNSVLKVKEGQKVERGAVIAEMGNTDAPDVRLHFEIRYKGKSVNPTTYLPQK